ncbi:MAG TPA: glycosyltransferase [Gammaproteobacteria bacterium]|nr:glycosyltransferase [Gammaproteobacteria bacterium]
MRRRFLFNKKRVLLIYDYFEPAVLAGGPIVSCTNLVKYLHNEYDFYIYTSNQDMDKSVLPVKPDQWLTYHNIAKVFYGDVKWSIKGYCELLKKLRPDVIYINGVYSFIGVMVPLILTRLLIKKTKIIIAPRGMLQTRALTVKRLKKKCYLTVFRRLVEMNSVSWHVTGEQEKNDLNNFLGIDHCAKIKLVGNIPSTNQVFVQRVNNTQVLKLLMIALVSPMKNILNVIKALQRMTGKVVYTLYGTIKEKDYWERCLTQIDLLSPSITVVYGGIAARDDIPSILASHDIYIQPSKSENFSHSIYEALMSGMPVITSHNTPWRVKDAGAGWNVDGEMPQNIAQALFEAAALGEGRYRAMSEQARRLGEEYLLQADLKTGYSQLFG